MAVKMPAEHGAWGILIIPFLVAAALAGVWNIPLLLTAIAALSLFILRGSIEQQGGYKMLRDPAHFSLFLIGLAAGLPLAFVYDRWQLILVGHIAIPLYAIQKRIARTDPHTRKEKRSLVAELLGVGILTLTAPAAWIAARSRLDAQGYQVWLLNLLFFIGGILYVKYRVRAIAAHRQFGDVREKLAFAWPVVVYHLMIVVFLAAWIVLASFPLAVILAFIPAVLRANALLLHLGQRFPIKRLGWTEVVHSVVFAALLIITLR